MSGLVTMDDAYFGPHAIASANSYGGGLVDTCVGAFVGGCDNPVGITCDVMSWGALGVTCDDRSWGALGITYKFGDDVGCGTSGGTCDVGSACCGCELMPLFWTADVCCLSHIYLCHIDLGNTIT